MKTPDQFDPLHPETLDDPYPYYASLREHAPVYRIAGTDVHLVSTRDLIQEALVQYLTAGSGNPKEREMAYHLFCARPFKLMAGQLKRVLKEDAWDS